MRAYILVTTEVGKVDEVEDQLRTLAINGIQLAVDLVAGSYDLVMVVEADDPKHVGRLVIEHVHRMVGVKRTVTLVSLR